MNDAIRAQAAGVDEALRAEIDGHHFYLMAAQSTADAQGRAVFARLADEELQHARFLKAQYRALLDTGRPDATVKLGQPTPLAGAQPIFSPQLRERLGQAHFEMSALSIGMQLELSAIQFYTAQADRAAFPEVAAFFRELAAWEKGHYDALDRQHQALRQDYWAGGGFSPF